MVDEARAKYGMSCHQTGLWHERHVQKVLKTEPLPSWMSGPFLLTGRNDAHDTQGVDMWVGTTHGMIAIQIKTSPAAKASRGRAHYHNRGIGYVIARYQDGNLKPNTVLVKNVITEVARLIRYQRGAADGTVQQRFPQWRDAAVPGEAADPEAQGGQPQYSGERAEERDQEGGRVCPRQAQAGLQGQEPEVACPARSVQQMSSRLLSTYTDETSAPPTNYRLVRVDDVRGTRLVAEQETLDALGSPSWKELFNINKRADSKLTDKNSGILIQLVEAMKPDTSPQGD